MERDVLTCEATINRGSTVVVWSVSINVEDTDRCLFFHQTNCPVAAVLKLLGRVDCVAHRGSNLFSSATYLVYYTTACRVVSLMVFVT